MPQLTTFKLAEPWPIAGAGAISDCFYEGQGKSRVISLDKVGDAIDLTRVNMPSFVKSSNEGHIHDLFMSGRYVPAKQEVSKEIEMIFLQETRLRYPNKFPATPGEGVRSTGPTETPVTVLEPGLTVATGPIQTVITPQDPALNSSVSTSGNVIEPGLTAGSSISGATEIQDNPETPSDPGSSSDTLTPDVDDEKDPQGPQESNWKDGLDAASQKEKVATSDDVAWLTSVSEDTSESKVIQKLAKTRLAEISSQK